MHFGNLKSVELNYLVSSYIAEIEDLTSAWRFC